MFAQPPCRPCVARAIGGGLQVRIAAEGLLSPLKRRSMGPHCLTWPHFPVT
eukprot:gene23659-29900_t